MSSGVAPLALIGGWTAAAGRQHGDFSSVRETISALAAHGAHDRWLMTDALVVVGLCHIVTAAGLHHAPAAGRAVLAGGGVATLGVATFPLDREGHSTAHSVVAFLAFVALAIWPLCAPVRTGIPALTPRRARMAGALLCLLVAWFFASRGTGHVGLAERAAAGAQALWPLVVVATALASARRASLAPDA